MIRTELDLLTNAARKMLWTVAHEAGGDDPATDMPVDEGEEVVQGALGLILFYCDAAEVDFGAALARAQDFVQYYLDSDNEMQRKAEKGKDDAAGPGR